MRKIFLAAIVLVVAVLGGASVVYFSTPSGPTKSTVTTAVVTTPTTAKPTVPEPNTLRIGAFLEPLSLDPANSVSGALWCVIRNTYEGLLKFKGSGTEEFEPLLATSWTVSPDSKVFTFTLRQGVKFHDGRPFNASCVKFSFERLIGTKRGPSVFYMGIQSIDVVNENTVRFTLKEPSSVFLKDLASLTGWQMMSPSAVKEHATADDPWAEKWVLDHSIGTGPYKITEWVREDRVVLSKFDGYWGGWKTGQIERVIMKLIREAANQKMMLEKGDIDVAENIAVEDQIVLKDAKGIKLDIPKIYSSMFAVQFDVSRPPLDDVKVRRGISYAINYDSYVKMVYGLGKKATGPIPSFMDPYFTSKYSYSYDAKMAAQLLDEAGWKLDSSGMRSKDGKKITLGCYVQSGDDFRRKIAEEMKSDLAKVGIGLDVVSEPITVATGRLSKGERPAHLYIMGSYGYSDPTGYLVTTFLSTNFPVWNMGGYNNAKVDELIQRLITVADRQERVKLADELQRIMIFDDPAAIYLIETPEAYTRLMRDWVQGRVYNPAYWRSLNIYDMWKGYA